MSLLVCRMFFSIPSRKDSQKQLMFPDFPQIMLTLLLLVTVQSGGVPITCPGAALHSVSLTKRQLRSPEAPSLPSSWPVWVRRPGRWL